MAAMSDVDRAKAARIICRRWGLSNIATVTQADVLAAVAAVDNTFEGTVASLPGTAGQSVIVRVNASLPAPFSGVSVEMKSLLLAVWAGVKYGLIDSGGD